MQLQCGPVSVDHSVLSTLKSLASKSFAVLERGWKLMDVTLVDFKVTPTAIPSNSRSNSALHLTAKLYWPMSLITTLGESGLKEILNI